MLQPPTHARRAFRLGAALLCGSAATLLRAERSPVAPSADADLAVVESPLRRWELTGNMRTAVGYKENILLSALHIEDSAFVQAEAEVFWWRLPTERFEALAFVSGT